MLKAIIFDFDGVIVESMDVKAQGFLYVFRQFPEIKDKILELHMTRGGMSRWEKFKIIYEQYLGIKLGPEKMNALADEFADYVFKRVVEAPYVKGALEFLTNNKDKYPFFIVSGTPQDEIINIIQQRGLEDYFKRVYGAPPKKAELIRKILKEYGYKPDEVVFVGDSLDDYEGAKESGIHFIGRELKNKNNFIGLADVKTVIKDLNDLNIYVK